VGAILSDEKQKQLAELLADTSYSTVKLTGRDVIAEEAAARKEKREKESTTLAVPEMSPALRELERQHKLLLRQLKVNQIRRVDKVETKEITAKDPGKIETEPLNGVYVNLNTFSDKLGSRDQRHEPDTFFKGLVKVPTKKELDKMTKDEEANESKTSRRHKDVPEKDDYDDDDDTGIQYPATFLIQLETGGRLQVPFQKNATVKSGLDKIAAKNKMNLSEWLFVTLSGQPVDPANSMGKVPGFSIMCVKKS